MPNDVINGTRIPIPKSEKFDTLNDLRVAIKAYAREVGFSVIMMWLITKWST